MNQFPLVSIVTPSFNQGRYLEETIRSVLRQDYPSVEYIIIDGGSSDGSVDIIKKYEDRLAYWVSEKDRGQTHALIKGFSRAKGVYMGWLCSDDTLEPSMIKISVHYLKKNPSLGMTFGDRIRIDAKGNIYSLDRFPAFKPRYLRWGISIPQETVLFRRDVYEKVGGLDESLQMVMDFDLWCKINKNYPIVHIPAFLGRFRAHGVNKSSVFSEQVKDQGFSEGWPAEYARIYRKHFGKGYSNIGHRLRKMLAGLTSVWERRSRSYRNELKVIERIRES